MRYFLCLSYDGGAFCGWQIQPSSPSVQACLEGTLSRLLNRPVSVTGAGRTDTGVHAAGYIAHFDWDGPLPFDVSDFTYKLNAMLPREVVVHSVTPVAEDLHARFSARRREYTYFIHRRKDPFLRSYSWQCGYPSLDFEAMNEACRHLLGCARRHPHQLLAVGSRDPDVCPKIQEFQPARQYSPLCISHHVTRPHCMPRRARHSRCHRVVCHSFTLHTAPT